MKLEVVMTNVALPDQFDSVALSSEVVEHLPRWPFDITRVYELRCVLGIQFSCTPAELDRATRDATQQVARIVNADTLKALDAIKLAIHAGKKFDALNLCDDLTKILVGGNQ